MNLSAKYAWFIDYIQNSRKNMAYFGSLTFTDKKWNETVDFFPSFIF